MKPGPKINLALSKADYTVEKLCKVFLVLMWILTCYTFIVSPPVIPTHFNISGRADGYGDKMTIFILPTIASIIYAGLTLLNKHPRLFNYPVKITRENAPKQYGLASRMLRFLKLGVLVIFSVIILFTYLTIKGVINGLGWWFVPVIIGISFTTVLITIGQSFTKKGNLA